ncbi:putative cyclic nucleotide-binding domain, rmlC-like jelly roll [Helianthus anomalus]
MIICCLLLSRPGKRAGSGRVGSWVKMGSGQNRFGSKRVNYKKGLFWFGSKRVRVEMGPGQNGFRVGLVNISHYLFYTLLDRAYLFHGVSNDVLFQLVSEMKAEYFPPKEDVILQNEASTDFYILVTGAVVSAVIYITSSIPVRWTGTCIFKRRKADKKIIEIK